MIVDHRSAWQVEAALAMSSSSSVLQHLTIMYLYATFQMAMVNHARLMVEHSFGACLQDSEKRMNQLHFFYNVRGGNVNEKVYRYSCCFVFCY